MSDRRPVLWMAEDVSKSERVNVTLPFRPTGFSLPTARIAQGRRSKFAEEKQKAVVSEKPSISRSKKTRTNEELLQTEFHALESSSTPQLSTNFRWCDGMPSSHSLSAGDGGDGVVYERGLARGAQAQH